MKMNFSLAILAAAAIAFAASPADAASKKKSKGSKAKVTVSKPAPKAYATGYWSSSMQACGSATAGAWYPIAAIGSVGCGLVYAVPVMVEGFWVRRA